MNRKPTSCKNCQGKHTFVEKQIGNQTFWVCSICGLSEAKDD